MASAEDSRRYRAKKRREREEHAAKVTSIEGRGGIPRPKVADAAGNWLDTVDSRVNPALIALARCLSAQIDNAASVNPATAAELRRTLGAIRAEQRQLEADDAAARTDAAPPARSRLDELRQAQASRRVPGRG